MSFKDLFKRKDPLERDIKKGAKWIVTCLNYSKYLVDYDLKSMKTVDRFFDEQSHEGGLLAQNRGKVLFSLGAFVGETAIRLYGGKWITNPDDPRGEVNVAVALDNGAMIYPVQKCIARYKNGAEDSIYAYLSLIGK